MQRRGSEVEKPHRRKTDMVAPIVEMRMTVVIWSLSLRKPKMTWLKIEVVLNRDTVRVPETEVRPRLRA